MTNPPRSSENTTSCEGDADARVSNRCYGCFRPQRLCFCDLIPDIEHQTKVLILQHRRESFHPFNTARIVHRALRHCDLMVDHNANLRDRFDSVDLSPGVGLLYPGDDAAVLSELAPDAMPKQLVILDGTWHHAKTLMRDIPRLSQLPRYRLALDTPGRYRIRKEPNEYALSTLEATVAAMKAIEPHNGGLDRLTSVFDTMIETQLGQTKTGGRVNKKRRRGSSNIPRALTNPDSSLVVAYGEQTLGGNSRDHRDAAMRPPVYWNAMRLGSGERFQCAIETLTPHTETFLSHLRLDQSTFDHAVSIESFRRRWKDFLRDEDQLVVYHHNTAKMLEHIDAAFVPAMVLKCVQLDRRKRHSTLDEFLENHSIPMSPMGESRAAHRLANAVAFVEYLRQHESAGEGESNERKA